jgi:hypothetical protein
VLNKARIILFSASSGRFDEHVASASDVIGGILGCGTVLYSGRKYPTFLRNLLLAFLGYFYPNNKISKFLRYVYKPRTRLHGVIT